MENERIHLLGPKPFADLPRYVSHFTVGIIPFVVNDLTRAVNPIKLREMLAAGCPVVSAALPEVSAVAEGREYVRLAEGCEQFVKEVISRVDSPLTQEQRRAISGSVADETWEKKVSELLGCI